MLLVAMFSFVQISGKSPTPPMIISTEVNIHGYIYPYYDMNITKIENKTVLLVGLS